MTENKNEENEIEKFRIDLAKFSGNYLEFLVIVKTKSGRLLWKSTDQTWAFGASHRFQVCADEKDRVDEEIHIKEERDEE